MKLSLQEDWLQSLLRLKDGRSRKVGSQLNAALVELWRDAIQSGRSEIRKGGHAESSSDEEQERVDEEDSSEEELEKMLALKQVSFKNRKTLEVRIKTFAITVLNCLRPKMLLVNQQALLFIQNHLIESLRLLCVVSRCSAAPSQQSITCASAKFSFPPLRTPNIRGKVSWDPRKQGWKVDIKSANIMLPPMQDKDGQTLCVEGCKGAVFQEKKKDAYMRAILTWNTLDRSTRARIVLQDDAAPVLEQVLGHADVLERSSASTARGGSQSSASSSSSSSSDESSSSSD